MTGRGRELVEVFKERKIKIACVQETKWTGKSARELGEGYKIFYSGSQNTRNGVGVILDQTYKAKVIEVSRPSDRLMRVKLVISGEMYNIISAYAPQTGLERAEKDKFLEDLECMIMETPNEKVIVGADLNGHVGKSSSLFTRVHGGKGYGYRNEDGERVLEWAESLDMAIANTFFEKKDEHLITYKSGNNATQIDYILVRRADLKQVKNCKVIPGECVVAQHRLLCATIQMEKEPTVKRKTKSKLRIWKLKGEEACIYHEKVIKEYVRKDNDTVEECWQNIKSTVLEQAEEVCGKTKGGKPMIDKETWWWNEEVQKWITQKKKAYKAWQKEKNEEKKDEYKEAKKRAKEAVAIAKEEACKEWYEKLDTKEGEQLIYKITKQRATQRRDISETLVVKDKEGNILTNGEKIKDRWKEYFEMLLNTENEREQLEQGEQCEGPEMMITKQEIKEALKKMKKGKAQGCSGLTVELIKLLEDDGVEMMSELFNKVFEEEKMPSDWQESVIVPIYKQKGDPIDCANYRGIKLLEHLMKAFERILDQRLRKIIEIDNMQFGFRAGRSTTDAVFVVTQVQEKHLEKKKDLFFTFVDLEKAYDRVPREVVYWCLRKKKVTEKLVRVVQATYQDSKTTVSTCHGQTGKFNIDVGLHQGSALSPFLFITVLDVISEHFREGAWKELLFADDLVVMAESEEELQERWLRWQTGMEKFGLKVNIKKTETMASSAREIELNIKDKRGSPLNQVNSFRYLGVTLSEKGGSELAVRARVKAAWNKWRECSGVMHDKKMPIRLKVKIYRTVIRPLILYGAETWVTRGAEERILESTEMRMLRMMKGVTLRDRVRSEELRRELGVTPLIMKVREKRLRWFGHVERREEDNIIRKMSSMEVEGKRPRGRPKKRWRDCIREDMREMNVEENDVANRNRWKATTRAADPT